MDSHDVEQAARKAGDQDALQAAARVGYAVNGLMHVLIGWIALQLAWAGSSASADQSGALGTLASNGIGKVALWVGVVGFLGLALWQLAEAIGGAHQASNRVKAAAKAVVYIVLSWSALTFAKGGSSSSSKQSADATTTLMSKPLGTALVAVVGLVIVAIGIYHVVKGWQRRFLRDLDEHPGDTVIMLGRFGYIAKGVALVIVGGLFGLAAARNNPKEATGLDGALHTLLAAPYGKALLTIVALGLVAYGLYSFARSRHARV